MAQSSSAKHHVIIWLRRSAHRGKNPRAQSGKKPCAVRALQRDGRRCACKSSVCTARGAADDDGCITALVTGSHG
jgi:hypothetical protein